MIRAVGFRNLIVHEYGKLDLEVVFRVNHEDVEDLERFCRELDELFG